MAKSSAVRYGPKVYESIIERVAKGELLKRICEEPDMPSPEAFYKHLERNPPTKARWDLALMQRVEGKLEDGLERINGLMESAKDGKALAAEVKAVDVALKHLQWLAERLNPGRYGAVQKLEHKHDGGTYVDVLRAAQGRIKPKEQDIAASQAEAGTQTSAEEGNAPVRH